MRLRRDPVRPGPDQRRPPRGLQLQRGGLLLRPQRLQASRHVLSVLARLQRDEQGLGQRNVAIQVRLA